MSWSPTPVCSPTPVRQTRQYVAGDPALGGTAQEFKATFPSSMLDRHSISLKNSTVIVVGKHPQFARTHYLVLYL